MRTPEQVRADEALTAAIEAVSAAYGCAGDDILGDYVVLAAWDRVDADGDVSHASSMLKRDGNLSRPRVVGLVVNQHQYLSAAALLDLTDQ